MKLLGQVLLILQVVFVVLKLVGSIDWSWWLVLTPFLVETAIVLVLLLTIAAVAIGVLKDDKR